MAGRESPLKHGRRGKNVLRILLLDDLLTLTLDGVVQEVMRFIICIYILFFFCFIIINLYSLWFILMYWLREGYQKVAQQ